MSARPDVRAVHETVLYARDVAACATFYRDVIGLRPVGTPSEVSAVLRLPEGDAVLLIFNPEHAARADRGVPSHGAWGVATGGGATASGANGHIAFRAGEAGVAAWVERLAVAGVKIEMEVPWERGGRSIYMRDPAGNSVELIEGRVWPP